MRHEHVCRGRSTPQLMDVERHQKQPSFWKIKNKSFSSHALQHFTDRCSYSYHTGVNGLIDTKLFNSTDLIAILLNIATYVSFNKY